MRRLLFVDDASRRLREVEAFLTANGDGKWETTFVDTGEDAIRYLGTEPFDILVTDVRSRVVDAAHLLRCARQQSPTTARVVLAAQSEFETAFQALSSAHLCLDKASDPRVLSVALARACAVQSLVTSPDLRALIGKLDTLPARPQIWSQLTSLIDDPNSSLSEMAELVEQDLAISARVVQVASSVFFARSAEIRGVADAVPRIGTRLLSHIVLAEAAFRGFDEVSRVGLDIEELHAHAFLTAKIARSFLPDRRMAEDAFLSGLLHDVGKLVIASAIPEMYQRITELAEASGRPRDAVERLQLGVDHGQVGGYLLGLWGLSFPIIEAVSFHHEPERVPQTALDLVGTVHIADSLANEVTGDPEDDRERVNSAYLEELGVADNMEDWRRNGRAIHEEDPS